MREFNRFCLIAGRRGGKTLGASIAIAEEATIPNSIIWCCAPTNPKLHRYVIPAVQAIIPKEWVAKDGWSQEYLDLRLINGTLIHMQTLEDPDQGRGQGVDCIWIDEASELTQKHWETIRPSLTERRGSCIISTSPRGFDWVYKDFYLRAEQGVPGYWGCKYNTATNPIIPLDELAEAKATMSPEMYRQEYEADFVVFTGAVYGGLIRPQVLPNDEAVRRIIPEWPSIDSWRQQIIGIDTGADHPFGGVKVVSTELGLVVVGEYLERDKTFLQHCAGLKRLAGTNQTKWALNKNERQGIIELAQHGIFAQKSENDIVAGTERIKSWLFSNKLWFVEAKCPKTIAQLEAYRWAENSSPKDEQKRKEKVFKVNDELADGLRYALMSWPELPSGPPEQDAQRDLSTLPENVRNVIMVERKASKDPNKVTDFSVVQDFWA